MQPADSDSPPLRQAALTLHALTAGDRGRVWSRLDPDKRAALEPLLAELRDLGIPSGQPWVKAATQHDAHEAAEAPDLGQLTRDVRRLRADAVLLAMSAQSLDTVACVLAWQPWPWRDTVLRDWSPESRHSLSQRVQEKMQTPVASHFAMSVLLGALLREVRAKSIVQVAAPAHRRTWFNRLLQR